MQRFSSPLGEADFAKGSGATFPAVSFADSRADCSTKQESAVYNDDQHDEDDKDDLHLMGSTPVTTAAQDRQASKAQETKEIEAMARRETNNLRAWRIILLLTMLSFGAIVATGTYVYISEQERSEVAQSYHLFTQTVKSASESQFQDFRRALTSMAQTVTVASLNSNRKFPFVRVPMVELPGSSTRSFSGVEIITWSPLVGEAERGEWSDFVKAELPLWYEQSKKLLPYITSDSHDDQQEFEEETSVNSTRTRDFIWRGDRNLDGIIEVSPVGQTFAPIWQCSPPPFSTTFINYDMMDISHVASMQSSIQELRQGLMSAVDPALMGIPDSFSKEGAFHTAFHDEYSSEVSEDGQVHPHSIFIQPVYDGLDTAKSSFAGFLVAQVAWDFFFANLLPIGVSGIFAVLSNTCSQSYTYVLDGRKALFIGDGDLHDKKHDGTKSTVLVLSSTGEVPTLTSGYCEYSISLYFSDEFKTDERSNLAILCATVVAIIFSVMAGAFFMYDRFVQRRNTKIISAAANSNAFLSTLFPTEIKKRLLEDTDTDEHKIIAPKQGNVPSFFLHDDDMNDNGSPIAFKSKPIADLFTETTILFADVAGFSAWSSVREPSQVFILLETLFYAFDEIAKNRRVFKVETVGDCYVACAGLPDARSDHAVVMARFAQECMSRMQALTDKLEVTFGPDTGELSLRMGLHSGPVTAGVLRGDRSRFQLFGDTMNIAARMESLGIRNQIHMSQETADLLVAAGKTKWVSKREDVIYTKGKGDVQTYWLAVANRGSESSSQKHSVPSDDVAKPLEIEHFPVNKKRDPKTNRLVRWSEDVLVRLLKQIVARRKVTPLLASERSPPNEARYLTMTTNSPVEEIKKSIVLPRFKQVDSPVDPDDVVLDLVVVHQLREFLEQIAAAHRAHDFHNFEHASHVAMSVVKLLSRIVDPPELKENRKDKKEAASSLHNFTYGIASDPLAQFTCVLAALVHEVDHPGVPNTQLLNERHELASRYMNKSITEQNAIHISWKLLFKKEFDLLRATIYGTDAELVRFRQIMVNSVLATDLYDSDLKLARIQCWERSFSQTALHSDSNELSNRKATIVIEFLLQASDISHTMQHWHVYRKWNERFFLEQYQAFVDKRADKDPATDWYEKEIEFFDFYVIPLAQKLKDCVVFGVSSEEYLNYAVRNRKEWEKRGRDMVHEMVDRLSGR